MRTKYSKCKCLETAFDEKFHSVIEGGKIVIRKQYRCRNCMRLLKTKDNESNAPIATGE